MTTASPARDPCHRPVSPSASSRKPFRSSRQSPIWSPIAAKPVIVQPETHHQGNSNTPQGEERNSTRETQNPHRGSKSAAQNRFRPILRSAQADCVQRNPSFPPPRSAVPTAKSAPRGLFISAYRLSRSGLPTFWRPLPTFSSPPTGSFGRIIRSPIRPFPEFFRYRVRQASRFSRAAALLRPPYEDFWYNYG